MKIKLALIAAVAALSLIGLSNSAFAADKPAKEITVTGEGKCGKCALKESDKCQNVIEAEKNGKKVTYWLAANDVSKNFHDNVCKEAKKVTATGTVKTEDGKKVLTATKIEVVKE